MKCCGKRFNVNMYQTAICGHTRWGNKVLYCEACQKKEPIQKNYIDNIQVEDSQETDSNISSTHVSNVLEQESRPDTHSPQTGDDGKSIAKPVPLQPSAELGSSADTNILAHIKELKRNVGTRIGEDPNVEVLKGMSEMLDAVEQIRLKYHAERCECLLCEDLAKLRETIEK